MRAARVAARYKHRPPEDLPCLVEDEFGFKIDPAVAKAVCEIKRQALRSDTRKQERLAAWLREHIETIACPDSYGGLDLENDEKRSQELRERRGTKVKLSAEEDAEEAYLTTRAEVYRATPVYQQANLARKAQIDHDIEWVRAQMINQEPGARESEPWLCGVSTRSSLPRKNTNWKSCADGIQNRSSQPANGRSGGWPTFER